MLRIEPLQAESTHQSILLEKYFQAYTLVLVLLHFDEQKFFSSAHKKTTARVETTHCHRGQRIDLAAVAWSRLSIVATVHGQLAT